MIKINNNFKIVYSLQKKQLEQKISSGREDFFENEGDDYFQDFGAFGSQRWWDCYNSGKMPTQLVTGKVGNAYFSGQDSRAGKEVNTVIVHKNNGETINFGFYCNDIKDRKLYKKGVKICILYAFDFSESAMVDEDSYFNWATVVEVAIEILSVDNKKYGA